MGPIVPFTCPQLEWSPQHAAAWPPHLPGDSTWGETWLEVNTGMCRKRLVQGSKAVAMGSSHHPPCRGGCGKVGLP